MFGYGEDIGLLRHCAETLLSNGTKFVVQMMEMHENFLYDCINEHKTRITSAAKATKTSIELFATFEICLNRAIAHRVQKSTDQNSTSSRSHLIIKMVDANNKTYMFADLAGFESQENKTSRAETKFINESLLELNKVFLSLVSKGQKPICTTPLTKFFKPYFENGDVIMFFHVKATSEDALKLGLSHIKDIVVSVNESKPKQKPLTMRN